MKQFCLPFLIFAAFLSAYSQTPETFRIPLKEKINLPLRHLPVELIRAYCEGNIKAYFPMDTSKECSYHEFVAHFGVGACQPASYGDDPYSTPCPQSFCASGDIYALDNFLSYVDLIQVSGFDKNLSSQSTRVSLVKLKYVFFDENRKEERTMEGPVFKYKEIAELGKDYLIPNQNNDAAKFMIKQVLDSRIFNGYLLKSYNTPGSKPGNPDFEREQNNWEH